MILEKDQHRLFFAFYFWLINLSVNNEHRAMRKKLQKQSFADILQNRCSLKFHKFHRKIPVLESLFNKAAVLKTCTLLRRDSNTGFFCEICETFKNTFFTEHLRWPLLKLNIYFSCRLITYYDRRSRLVQMWTLRKEKRSEKNRWPLL